VLDVKVTIPFAGSVKESIDKMSPVSISESFDITFITTGLSSSVLDKSSSVVGASFTPVTVMLTVAILLIPPLPSETVYVKVSVVVAPSANALRIALSVGS